MTAPGDPGMDYDVRIAHSGRPVGAELWHSEFRLTIVRAILSSYGPSKIRSLEPYVKLHHPRPRLALWAFSLLGVLLLQSPAIAHLGGDTDSVSADRDAMQAQLHSTPMQLYSVHEISTAAGALIHEYTTRQGTVFAVTWQGQLPPDLAQLFGNYYKQYQDAAVAQSRPGMHRQLNISNPDFVVASTGRMRSFRGKAYVPSLVPAGVSIADLP
jgi:hypothetical protein